ncbi:MAG: ATP-binding cassette domain-containing protein, partial [Anaerolineales bacterium]|nr:ATP-binding cassette domain-containing protein [Anaerolineales bacterium]
MADPTYILETRDLARHFGGLKAVEGVHLKIQAGHLHSIIGPNGAGKTTLFNLLSGALKPSRGQVFLRGQ